MECIHKNCPLSDDPTAKLVEALSECVSRFKWLKIYGSLSHAADWKKCERTMGKAKAVLAEVKDV
ncbi:hypothetical protein [Desulfatibacillum aliphaticivorans]|nr:hypothetical protein [Desulfatibacillum aliphaticivorans]